MQGGQPFPVSCLTLSILKLGIHAWYTKCSGPHQQETEELRNDTNVTWVQSGHWDEEEGGREALALESYSHGKNPTLSSAPSAFPNQEFQDSQTSLACPEQLSGLSNNLERYVFASGQQAPPDFSGHGGTLQ